MNKCFHILKNIPKDRLLPPLTSSLQKINGSHCNNPDLVKICLLWVSKKHTPFINIKLSDKWMVLYNNARPISHKLMQKIQLRAVDVIHDVHWRSLPDLNSSISLYLHVLHNCTSSILQAWLPVLHFCNTLKWNGSMARAYFVHWRYFSPIK